MEINRDNPAIKKELYTNKKEPKNKIHSRDKDSEKSVAEIPAAHSNEEIHDLQATTRKAILRSQAIVGGLENFKSLTESTDNAADRATILKDIISKTVQDTEQVLKQYAEILYTTIQTKDYRTIDRLIHKETANIEEYSIELGRYAVKEQNMKSLASEWHTSDPEALLQAVIRQLREDGEPQLNLPGNRVLDLLGE